MKQNDINERDIITMMRDEYHRRLLEAIAESDVFDDRGNMVLAKDLKVRHKKSQFEYTIEDIIEDPANDDVQVVLRLPDEPRFDPPPEEKGVLTDFTTKTMLGEDELMSIVLPAGQAPPELYDDSEEDVFVIDREEFEKEYEVK